MYIFEVSVKGQIWKFNVVLTLAAKAAITPETEPWTPYLQAGELSWREQGVHEKSMFGCLGLM